MSKSLVSIAKAQTVAEIVKAGKVGDVGAIEVFADVYNVLSGPLAGASDASLKALAVILGASVAEANLEKVAEGDLADYLNRNVFDGMKPGDVAYVGVGLSAPVRIYPKTLSRTPEEAEERLRFSVTRIGLQPGVGVWHDHVIAAVKIEDRGRSLDYRVMWEALDAAQEAGRTVRFV